MSPLLRALPVSLLLLSGALPALAQVPDGATEIPMEQLPPVDTGADAVKGDYLDLENHEKGPEITKTIQVTIGAKGIEPRFIALEVGKTVKLVFRREVEETCASSLASKELGLEVEIPLDKPVEKIVTATKKGDFLLQCPSGRTGMGVQVK